MGVSKPGFLGKVVEAGGGAGRFPSPRAGRSVWACPAGHPFCLYPAPNGVGASYGRIERIVFDWAAETGLAESVFFRGHGIASGIAVPIPANPSAFGVLSVQAAQAKQFNFEDAVFLRAIANTLGAAIARCETETPQLRQLGDGRRVACHVAD